MTTIDKHIETWVKNAEKDLESSSNMFSAGIFDQCLFDGLLALEKIFKALWIKANNDIVAPGIHDLMLLAELSRIELSDDLSEFLRIVNQVHVEARFKKFREDFTLIATKEYSQQNLIKINETFLWLKLQIK